MASKRTVPAMNRLLQLLPAADLIRMKAQCTTVQLTFGEVLYEPGDRIAEVYFPSTSFISLIMPVDDTSELEVGLVGREGMFGVPLMLGLQASPFRALVQGHGEALRIDADGFRDALRRSTALHSIISRYTHVQISQLAQTAGCTRFHVVESRLARWLLMTQDRADSTEFKVTQEFLSAMLGVRRVGVNKAARSLQQKGLISYSRGAMRVLKRAGLKAASCGCYKADNVVYSRIMAA